jgi:hypothetical protein
MKGAGYSAGYPDVVLLHKRGSYGALFLEIKAKSKPTPEQLEWQKALNAEGYKAVIMPSGLNFSDGFNFLRDTVEDYLRLGDKI